MAVASSSPGIFETIDDAFHSLRELPVAAWLWYFCGAIPFLLSLLWAATETNVLYSSAKGLGNSLLCACAFVWMQYTRVRFAAFLDAGLHANSSARWTFRQALRSLAIQSALQTAKLIAMPLALAMVLPLAWVTAFFRNVTVLLARPGLPLRELLGQSARLSSPHQRQLWLVLCILSLLTLFALLNVALLMLILPSLLKTLTGVENQITRGTGGLNWRFFETACGLTWLILEPLMQAFFVLRLYAIESTASGADLLDSLRRHSFKAAAAVMLLCCAGMAHAEVPPPVLQHNIQQVLQERQYSWHTNEKESDEAESHSMLSKLAHAIERAVKQVGAAIDAVFFWIRNLFNQDSSDTPEQNQPAAPKSTRWLLIALGVLIAIGLVFFLRRRPATEPIVERPTAPAIDLRDESVGAADLPEDGWLAMARDCAARGDFRLALRALYLATLAHLGDRDLLTLANTKTNRDYLRELRRRSANDQLQQTFQQSVRNFEASWYGRHETGERQLEEFQRSFEAVRTYAQ